MWTRESLVGIGLVTLAFAGCFSGTSDETEIKDDPTEQDLSRTIMAYLHDLSPADTSITRETSIEETFMIPMQDGKRLYSAIIRPPGPGPFPLVLEVTPYFGGGSLKDCVDVVDESRSQPVSCMRQFVPYLLPRGYALGFLSLRGTGQSEGCFTQGDPQEARDIAAGIEFLAAQPWSDGSVGVIGLSWPGTTGIQVWEEAPPSLKTVVSGSGISEMYKYNFVNGLHIDMQGWSFNAYSWAIVGVLPVGIQGGSNTDPASTATVVADEACPDQVSTQYGGLHAAMTADYSPYWQVRNFTARILEEPDKQRPPLLYFQGFEDWNVKPHNTEPFLSEARAHSTSPVYAMIGHWNHHFPLRHDWHEGVMVAWFDKWLKGIDTGVEDLPRNWLQDDQEVWRAERTWPDPDAEQRRLYLHPGHKLAWTPSDASATYSYLDAEPEEFSISDPRQDPTVVVLRSEPLREALHLTHMPFLHVAVTSSAPKANLVVTVMAEAPDGSLRSLNWAMQSLNHLGTPEKGRHDISGVPVTGVVPFFPQEDVIAEGDRFVVVLANHAILTDGGPDVIPPSWGGTITVDAQETWIDLLVDPSIVTEDPQPERVMR